MINDLEEYRKILRKYGDGTLRTQDMPALPWDYDGSAQPAEATFEVDRGDACAR